MAVNGAAMVTASAASAAAAVAVSTTQGAASSSAALAAPTLTTPTLTPTTLRNIEQMFMDSESQAADEVRPPDVHEHSARFEPPAVSISTYPADETSKDEVNAEPTAPPPPKWVSDGSVLPGPHSNEEVLQSRQTTTIQLPTVPLRLVSADSLMIPAVVKADNNGHSVTLPPVAVPPPLPTKPSSSSAVPANKKRASKASSSGGGRRPASTSGLSPEEEQKKILRRQRNKEAAARCRKRRLDQTTQLQDEVSLWESRNSDLNEEIQALEAQRLQLEATLAACRKERAGKAVAKGDADEDQDSNRGS